MSLKNSNDTIGNRIRDLPVSSVVQIKQGTWDELPSNGKQECGFFEQDGSTTHTASNSSTVLTLNIPRGVPRGPPLVCYWLTSVEINKHKIFDTNNA